MEKSLKKYCVIVIILLLAIVAVIIFSPLRKLFMPIVAGAVLAYFLRGPVRWLEKKLPRTWSVVIVFAVLLLIIGLAALFVIPVLAREISELASRLPEYADNAYELISSVFARLGVKTDSLNSEIYKRIEVFVKSLSVSAGKLIDNISDISESLLLYGYSPILAFFLLKDAGKISAALLYLLPFEWRRPVVKTVRQMDTQLWRYISSIFATAAFVAALTAVGMWAAGVRYAPVLGLIAGAFDLIPFIGPIISIIPIVAVAAAQGGAKILWALAVLLIVQQIESFVLNPMIVGGNLKLHPAIIILAVLVGNLLFGVAGMIFSVPLILIMRVISSNIYESMIKT